MEWNFVDQKFLRKDNSMHKKFCRQGNSVGPRFLSKIS